MLLFQVCVCETLAIANSLIKIILYCRGRLFAMIIDLPTVQEILLYHVEEKVHVLYIHRNSGPLELCKLSCLGSNLTRADLTFSCKKRSSGPDEANEVVEEQEVYLIEEQVWLVFGAIHNIRCLHAN